MKKFVRRVEPRKEQGNDKPGKRGIVGERVFHIGLGELNSALQQELAIGSQEQNLSPFEAGPQHKIVESVICDMPGKDTCETRMEGITNSAKIDRHPGPG